MRAFARIQAKNRRPHERGFTLLELVLASGILALALMFAAQVLLESQRMMTRTNRALVQRGDHTAAVFIRSDLRAASYAILPLTAVTTAWQEGPLLLDNPFVGDVSYTLTNGELIREVRDSSGTVTATRPVMKDVAVWRWRPLTRRLLEVEIGHQQETSPLGTGLLLDRERRTSEIKTTSVRGFLRDRAGRSRW